MEKVKWIQGRYKLYSTGQNVGKSVIWEMKEMKKVTSSVFTYLEKAFDRIDREVIWRVMETFEIERWL